MKVSIPTFTKDEDDYYEKLLNDVAIQIGVPEIIDHKWLCNDERSRMIWYFIAKKLENNNSMYFNFKNSIEKWRNDKNINDYWYVEWNNLFSRIEKEGFSVLYESSEKMQELRSMPPDFIIQIDSKLRYKILKFILNKYK